MGRRSGSRRWRSGKHSFEHVLAALFALQDVSVFASIIAGAAASSDDCLEAINCKIFASERCVSMQYATQTSHRVQLQQTTRVIGTDFVADFFCCELTQPKGI